jgi:SSS family solute:Na+ symporter
MMFFGDNRDRNVHPAFYNKLSWQGTQGFNASAKSAHEAKMGEVLSTWRWIPQNIMFVVVPVIACVVMKYGLGDSAAITDIQHSVNASVDSISKLETKAIGDQMITPLVLVKLLPSGLMGALTAAMLASTIGTHASYLHSWGAIFIQDVVMPFRRKPFESKQHLRLLRWSILGVAVFIFFFSLFFKNSEKIWPFLMITGAIFCGGSGAVIIGGLYWKRGTTRGAWTALIAGSSIAVGAILLTNYWNKLPDLACRVLNDGGAVRHFFAIILPPFQMVDRTSRVGRVKQPCCRS